MIQIETKCLLCNHTSLQPLDAPPAFGGGGGRAMLDGLDLGHRWRGLKLCPTCRACAPDLTRPVPGLGARAVRDGQASAAFRDALAVRAALPGAPDVSRPDAMRWLAYASVFGVQLAPGAAGLAWACAAAELEMTRLRPLGAEWADPAPRPDLAKAARQRAVGCLDRVVRADFPRGVLPAGLARALHRGMLGETLRGTSRVQPDGTGGFAWRRDLGRFDTACLLVELHRRLGEFGLAQDVAARVLQDAKVPAGHAAVLRRQTWLARAMDSAPHELHRPLRPQDDTVPAPVPAMQPELMLLAA